MDIYFILWVIIHYYFKDGSIFGDWELFQLDPLCPFNLLLLREGFVFSTLLSGITRCIRLILYISCPSPGIIYFSEDSWFLFYWKWY